MENLIPHLIWAGFLGAVGVVVLLRAASASLRQDLGRDRGSWLSLLLLYLAVGLLAWGLVAAVAEDRSERKRLEEWLLRLSERNMLC